MLNIYTFTILIHHHVTTASIIKVLVIGHSDAIIITVFKIVTQLNTVQSCSKLYIWCKKKINLLCSWEGLAWALQGPALEVAVVEGQYLVLYSSSPLLRI